MDYAWEENMDGIWKEIPERNIECRIVPIWMNDDMGFTFEYRVTKDGVVVDDGKTWDQQSAQERCDKAIRRIADGRASESRELEKGASYKTYNGDVAVYNGTKDGYHWFTAPTGDSLLTDVDVERFIDLGNGTL